LLMPTPKANAWCGSRLSRTTPRSCAAGRTALCPTTRPTHTRSVTRLTLKVPG